MGILVHLACHGHKDVASLWLPLQTHGGTAALHGCRLLMVGGVNCKSAGHRDAGVSRWGRKYLQGPLNAVFLILSEYSICLAPAGSRQPTAGASPSHGAVPGITSQPAGIALLSCLILGALCRENLLRWEPCARPSHSTLLAQAAPCSRIRATQLPTSVPTLNFCCSSPNAALRLKC